MRIGIFSGGTGSTQLQEGLAQFPSIEITHFLNAYDDGKSTGVVRDVFNVLGPSDIRKIQYNKWKLKKISNEGIEWLFESREDITDKDKIYGKLYKYHFEGFIPDFEEFYSNFTGSQNQLKDFSLANILYASKFKKIGYEKTIEYFNDFLGVFSDIKLNSFENEKLSAVLTDRTILSDEASIVSLNDSTKRRGFFSSFSNNKVFLKSS